MDTFKREERYIVVKLSDLDYDDRDAINGLLAELCVPGRECLVIESDWPEYEPTWATIERRMTGGPAVEQPQVNADLLKALEAAVADCDQIASAPDEMELDWVDDARAAIAKAKAVQS